MTRYLPGISFADPLASNGACGAAAATVVGVAISATTNAITPMSALLRTCISFTPSLFRVRSGRRSVSAQWVSLGQKGRVTRDRRSFPEVR
jgi:hypothetical protein